MSLEWLFVLSIILLISTSGILINFYLPFHSKVQKTDDSKSLSVFRLMVPLGIMVSFIVFLSGTGNYDQAFGLVFLGLFMIGIGLFLRWRSILILKKHFTVQVSIVEDHQLVTNGLFKFIRHPSYLGMIIYYLGLGLLMHNWISIIILFVFPLIPIILRIKQEEEVLRTHFKKLYIDYCERTWKLIPYLF